MHLKNVNFQNMKVECKVSIYFSFINLLILQDMEEIIIIIVLTIIIIITIIIFKMNET